MGCRVRSKGGCGVCPCSLLSMLGVGGVLSFPLGLFCGPPGELISSAAP